MFAPYDHIRSSQLDCVTWLLDHEQRRIVRWLLRCYKAALESQVM